jgi:hypothetical protein
MEACAAWTYNPKQTNMSCHLKTASTPTITGGECTSGSTRPGPSPAPQPKPNPNKKNILFLMCDSMDGRVLDPTSPVSSRVAMPNLRELASQGTNFVSVVLLALFVCAVLLALVGDPRMLIPQGVLHEACQPAWGGGTRQRYAQPF